jgi:hypothetical protein
MIGLIMFCIIPTLECVSGFFVREANPAYVLHGKKSVLFLKHRGDVQEGRVESRCKKNRM